jgi:hypothetical protein
MKMMHEAIFILSFAFVAMVALLTHAHNSDKIIRGKHNQIAQTFVPQPTITDGE